MVCREIFTVEVLHYWTHRHGHLQGQSQILILGIKHAHVYATAGTWGGSRGCSTSGCVFQATCAVHLQEQQQLYQGTEGLTWSLQE